MSGIKYTAEQIEELLKNKYVEKCSAKSITFSKECKQEAVKLWDQWDSSKEVFLKMWFPDYVSNSRTPIRSINRWRKNNEKWMVESKRWRKKNMNPDFDPSKMTKDEYIEYLEAKLAIVEELKKIDRWEYP